VETPEPGTPSEITGSLCSAVAEGTVRAKGDYRSRNYPVQANIQIHGAPIAALLANYVGSILEQNESERENPDAAS
jgi:hypothetical protein